MAVHSWQLVNNQSIHSSIRDVVLQILNAKSSSDSQNVLGYWNVLKWLWQKDILSLKYERGSQIFCPQYEKIKTRTCCNNLKDIKIKMEEDNKRKFMTVLCLGAERVSHQKLLHAVGYRMGNVIGNASSLYFPMRNMASVMCSVFTFPCEMWSM